MKTFFKSRFPTFVIIVLSIIFIIIGIINGEYIDILNKATRVCLECIGIG